MNTPVQTAAIQSVSVIDSHTAGEPTRVVLSGGPPLGDGPLFERCQRLRLDFDHWRSALACEPRGSDTMVGALLVEPHAPDCVAGVIFFNNVGVLGMCGHGAIGVVTTLAHLGRIGEGVHRIDTPVGVVSAQLHADGSVTIANVPSWRLAAQIKVEVPGIGSISGDIAWGGNWFFLCDYTQGPLELAHIETLTDYCWRIRQSLQRAGITGADGAEIDHIELSGAPLSGGSARNFVLCPGKAYDRSPCGTGTSAKLACLAADGKLAAEQLWSQESVIGSMFEARYSHGEAGKIHPSIRGRAWIMAQSTLYFARDDPFRHGIRA